MSERLLSDDEVDRLLREALADDLPKELEDGLRGGRTGGVAPGCVRASACPVAAWLEIPANGDPVVPQPALVAAALAMLAAGAVMQAAPPPHERRRVVEGRQAAARVAQGWDGPPRWNVRSKSLTIADTTEPPGRLEGPGRAAFASTPRRAGGAGAPFPERLRAC